MTDRERLLALLEENWIDFFKYEPVYQNSNTKIMTLHIDKFVDFLLASGVTFATDTNSGNKWISVTERLPRYNHDVLVYRPNMGVKILTDSYVGYYGEDDSEWYEGWAKYGRDTHNNPVITHWMPLPEPPKEDE